jgi:hypothetical protein
MVHSVKKLWKNTDGSEAIEMVSTVAMACALILVGIMILSYLIACNNVSYATKRVVRQIEVTGIASQTEMNTIFNGYLGTSDQIVNRNVVATQGISSGKVNLKGTFKVMGSCDYIIPIVNPGSFDGYTITLPIVVSVSGMSEVYKP